MRNLLLPLTLICALVLSGCSGGGWSVFPGVHRVPVQQGSKITQDMVDQLRPGMTKAQVRYVLGTPLLADTFDQDRWDYYYVLKDGKGDETKERISVFFVDDLLDRFEGDFVPSAVADSTSD